MVAVSLLDINVLLALAWPNHVRHAAAHRWFSGSASLAWASCPLTQLGFVRLAMQPAVVREEIRARVAGHQQLTDAVLLDLAMRPEGRLATFDRRVAGLLPPDSAEREAVAIIPVDG